MRDDVVIEGSLGHRVRTFRFGRLVENAELFGSLKTKALALPPLFTAPHRASLRALSRAARFGFCLRELAASDLATVSSIVRQLTRAWSAWSNDDARRDV